MRQPHVRFRSFEILKCCISKAVQKTEVTFHCGKLVALTKEETLCQITLLKEIERNSLAY